ncbi:DoxX family protein [Corynebacterium felinum]|uniref:Membrane protein YphA (DoxX/SURF4 family)/rubrerythrin n=1 Tax=Corynebacterium felinum TaxID=131318 RepID=A0ABU2BA64_9CORY|nr:DoxX family protein [Corynebacterium felinum]MDF5820457.1 DoxX family protein [Corynebacterium felinum]MDR7355495.1 putative membrane protein YphA (DoxX/SURF4 family)/rubrerythrin [Corynebacterium felinum]WJY94846.1 DoxX [Corynebacterium felinum]
MLRKLARPMVASVYIADGADTVLNTQAHVEGTQMVMRQLRVVLPRRYYKMIPQNPELITQAIGATKVAAGSILALGKAPRTSASVLALLSVPTILARHAFWETQDAEEKTARRQGFLTSVALLGGLFITSADTAGKPGLKWRAQKAAKKANKQIQQALPTQSESEKIVASASEWLDGARQESSKLVDSASEWIEDATEKVSSFVEDNRDDWADTAREWLDRAQENSKVAKKKVLKAAVAAQDKAQAAFADAQDATGRTAKKATKQADKLQVQAQKAFARAQKKLDKKF